mmetsp:Transcript_29612/g.91467  ORF Transcript_29612/g.91467 Transcript_29612/m.91467 type:complete len:86 (+) Transcript_29612:104-361(+)
MMVDSSPTGAALTMPNRGIADPLDGLLSPESVLDRLVGTIAGDVDVANVIDRPTSEKVWRLICRCEGRGRERGTNRRASGGRGGT